MARASPVWHTPPDVGSSHADFHTLLMEMFSAEELRCWLSLGPDRDLVPHLPTGTAPLAEVARALIELLSRRGRLDTAFFERLKTERPRRREEIAKIAAAYSRQDPHDRPDARRRRSVALPLSGMAALLFGLTWFGLGWHAGWRTKTCPPRMVFVEGGSFAGHRIADLCVDRTEVTLEGFKGALMEINTTGSFGGDPKRCNANDLSRGEHPVNCVSVAQAADFCKSLGKRLPTEREWEWAARGRDEGRAFPWGDGPPTCARVAVLGCGADQTVPVGSRSPAGDSRDGLTDMSGGVWEWTYSDSGRPVLRGGGWVSGLHEELSVQSRAANFDATARLPNAGFRCVMQMD